MQKQGVLVILGRKGSGKTQLARRFLQEQSRVVVIDTIGEYNGVQIEDPWSLSDYLDHARHLAEFHVSYRDRGTSSVPPEQVFQMLQGLRDCWLGLEEASKWMQSGYTPDEIKWFLQYGRHNGISVLLVARRPSELDRMGTAQADTVVSFEQHEPRDLDYIRKIGGDDAVRRVAALADHEWDYVLDEHAEIRETLDRVSMEVEHGARVDTAAVESAASGSPGGGLVDPASDGEGPDGASSRSESGGSSGLVSEAGDAARGRARSGGDGTREAGEDQQGDSRAPGRGRRRKARKVGGLETVKEP